jgi:ferritin-like metal-binding protein YciE
MDTDKQETIVTQLTDQHALVNYGLKTINEQIANLTDRGYPEVMHELRRVRTSLEKHEEVLDARVRILGRTLSAPIKDAFSAVAGVAAGIIHGMRSDEALKSIRDDSTFINHLAVSYLILDTTARAVGDLDTAAIAESGYRDAARMLIEIDRLLPGLVLEELRRAGVATVADVSNEVRRTVKEAWDLAEGAATIH